MKNIFISSTFIDMQAERDLVQERVLPIIRDRARKFGDNVGVIDLRWGVDTSTLETEEGSKKVLKVCLDEIDRSHPYMLIFLGERYGTMMREDQIAQAVQNKTDKYTPNDFIKSITALEVEYGALSEKYGQLDRCVVCFREPVVHMLDGAEKELYAEHFEQGKQKLKALKEQIKQDLGDDKRLITYSAVWDKSIRKLVNFQSQGKPLEDVLIQCFTDLFQEDWKQYETLNWQDKEQLEFRALIESKLHSFVGRETLLETYYQTATQGECPLILQGEIGSGKTAIMCKLIERLQKEGKQVFPFFAGAGNMSTDTELLVKQMVYYVENILETNEHFGQNDTSEMSSNTLKPFSDSGNLQYADWLEHLQNLCYSLPGQEKIYFCIDALDQLFPDEHIANLDFFPSGKNVQIIASCITEFELPSIAKFQYSIENIPALNETDAQMVAKGIFASYSRNTYAAIEQEMLQKKRIGNPLYISLLIQRLNMMDADELRQAMKEEDIIALGTDIIRTIPDELDEAMVSIIQNGIDKVSDNKILLQEILNYLAVSNNGLRLQDLHRILETQNLTFHALDFTLFMKYLSTFFYTQEDGRINFTHKAIRQGLNKKIKNAHVYARAIKEYLKKQDENDVLRIQEGMYFARTLNDEEFATELFLQAYISPTKDLVQAIRKEAVADGGTFYCQLIDNQQNKSPLIYNFMQEKLLLILGMAKEESATKLKLTRALLNYRENQYKKVNTETNLLNLTISYYDANAILRELGHSADALSCGKLAVENALKLYNENETEDNLCVLLVSYSSLGKTLSKLGQKTDALFYYQKVQKYLETSNNLNERYRMSINYLEIGNTLKEQGHLKESLFYFEKAKDYNEIEYQMDNSLHNLNALAISYGHLGRALRDLGNLEEAFSYSEKALHSFEKILKKENKVQTIQSVSTIYSEMGTITKKMGHLTESLSYYQKALEYMEVFHEKAGSNASLYELSMSYNDIASALSDMGKLKEAIPYYKKKVNCNTAIYEEKADSISLQALILSYNETGYALNELKQLQDALFYHKEAMKYAEILYAKDSSNANMWTLAVSYDCVGHILCNLEMWQDALQYFQKEFRYVEILHKNKKDAASLLDLTICMRNLAEAFFNIGNIPQAYTFIEDALVNSRELYEQEKSDYTQTLLLKCLFVYAEILLTDQYAEKSLNIYRETLSHSKSLYEKMKSRANAELYIKALKGMHLCLLKSDQQTDAEKYLALADVEIKKWEI